MCTVYVCTRLCVILNSLATAASLSKCQGFSIIMNLNLSTPLPTCPCMAHTHTIHINETVRLACPCLIMFNNFIGVRFWQCVKLEIEMGNERVYIIVLTYTNENFPSLVLIKRIVLHLLKPFNSFHYTFRLGSNLKNVHRHWYEARCQLKGYSLFILQTFFLPPRPI